MVLSIRLEISCDTLATPRVANGKPNVLHCALQLSDLIVLHQKVLFIAEVLDDIFVPRVLVDGQDEGFDGWIAFDESTCVLRQLNSVARGEDTNNAPGTAFTMATASESDGV